MKKLITIALAAAMLLSSLPAAFAEETKKEVTLDASSALTINAETGYIENIPELMQVNELLTNFRDKKDLTVTNASGKALTLTDTVGTDAVISVGDSSVKTLVHGDVNRDAKITTSDAIAILQSLASMNVNMVKEAADVTYDGKMTATDAIQIIRYLAGWDVDIRNLAALAPLTAPNEDSDIEILFESIMNRIGATNTDPSDKHTYTLRLAKNEIETLQFFLTTTEKKKGMSLEVGEIANENGAVLEAEVLYGYYYSIDMLNGLFSTSDYMDFKTDRYVEPMPRLVNPFDLTANESKAFYVKVKTSPETEAGLYKSTINLKDADGNIVKTAEFRVYVWDFTLDEETASATAFHLSRWDLNTISGNENRDDLDESDRRYSMYYDFMLENRLTAYNMPYDPLDERANEYMSNPRVTSFCVAGGDTSYEYSDANNARLVSIYKKLRTNEDWLEKGYIYTVDEPVGDGLLLVQQQWEWACSILPEMDFRIILPLGLNSYYTKWDCDAVAFVEPYITNWCPSAAAFTPYAPYSERRQDPETYPSAGDYSWSSDKINEKYGQFSERYNSFREDGDTMWWYICVGPVYPYANFFKTYQGYGVRTVLWEQYLNDVDGLLYWLVNNWEGVTKNRITGSGDGLLLYWGELFGQEFSPVTSVRLEYVRDGIEDFQYLTQLEGLTDRATAEEYVKNVTTSVLSFSEDYNDTEDTRAQIGFLLEELYSK